MSVEPDPAVAWDESPDSSGGLVVPVERWTRNYQASLTLAPQEHGALPCITCRGDCYRIDVLGRGYYVNDQRIEFTGQEATFGVEGIVAGAFRRDTGDWALAVESELYLNQPFDRNRLREPQERASYLGNFEIDPLEISQLLLSARHGEWLLAIGKMVTPFGRTYFPLYLNDRRDAPFIRTESIQWRETGLLVQYDPGLLVLTGALVNGCEDMDTNSSKAFIGRIGLGGDCAAVGGSVKMQDGIGSEWQKMFNNHAGLDAMVRCGRATLSAEVIYDEYGFREPAFSADEITWYRGVYHREQCRAWHVPLTGLGYYMNLGYEGRCWGWLLNYGEFYPLQNLGDPVHDVATRRGIGKLVYRRVAHWEAYLALMVENDVPNAQAGRVRKGGFLLTGFQASF